MKGTTLVVAVSDPAWATQLRFLEHDLIERLQVELGQDAIDTIENSVARMSALLGKLQQRSNAERRPVALQEALLEAVRKCQQLNPRPALRVKRKGYGC
jgi:hypothetical protein